MADTDSDTITSTDSSVDTSTCSSIESLIHTPKNRTRHLSKHCGLNKRSHKYFEKKSTQSGYVVSSTRSSLQQRDAVDDDNNVSADSGEVNGFRPIPSPTDFELEHDLSSTDLDSDVSFSTYSSISDSDIEREEEESEIIIDEKLTEERKSDTDSIGLDGRSFQDHQIPIYNGSSYNLISIFTMIMMFVIKHCLTKEAFADLILLIQTLIPPTASKLMSCYKIKKRIEKLVGYHGVKEVFFCSQCTLNRKDFLENEEAKCDFCGATKFLSYNDLTLEEQLKNLFKDEKFCNLVTDRKRNEVGVISDITNGSEYKRLMETVENNSASNTIHITLTMNTDGVSIFQSSKKGSLWPVYVGINELPIKLRFSRRYILPCYLTCNADKPNMVTYLEGFVDSLLRFQSGLEIETFLGTRTVKAYLLAACLDLPARAMVSNMKQFNGKYGCSTCFHEGSARPNLPIHRYYPYSEDILLRNHNSFVEDSREAALTKEAVRGIKGASPLMRLDYLDMSTIFPVDWMHCVLLGLTKQLMSMWFDPNSKSKAFYIGNKKALIDQRLLGLKVPDFIVRPPRTVEDYKHWKATECKEWLIHFSVPVLDGILQQEVYTHYLLLVTSMFLLNQEAVKEREIDVAENLITDFCKLFPCIYGVEKQTMNLHLINHLPLYVRRYGPLFQVSCFGFESMNSSLKKMINGTRFINNQICFAVAMSRGLPDIAQSIAMETENHFLINLMNKLTSHFIRE